MDRRRTNRLGLGFLGCNTPITHNPRASPVATQVITPTKTTPATLKITTLSCLLLLQPLFFFLSLPSFQPSDQGSEIFMRLFE